ncbi:MAG TPA: tetratricopeptide repeat protein, partial [Kofleriaceae bacterium]|nr:tetratricopeptide repeat protein [Kofleriaceae bacterium]
ALPAPDRWLAPVVQHLIGDELADAWGLDVELAASDHPAPGTLVIGGQLARDPSGRLRLELDGAVLEAATPRALALAAAARVVTRHVAEAARHPTRAELAAVGAHDAEAWRLWRRAQHETLLLRWERATALIAEARARDPEFAVAALEAALLFDNKDAAADRQLAAAVALMDRVPVRPIWRMVATATRQLMTNDAAAAARTLEAARRLELEPRERLWIELRWAMALLFEGSPQDATAALELIAERNPGHPSAFKLLAGIALASDAPTAPILALRHAARAVELAPDDAGARADLAVALLAAGRRDEARARADELARLDPEDKRLARNRLFTLHMALGDLAEAEVDARRQLTGAPSQRAEGTGGVALIDLHWGRFERGVGELAAAADQFDALGMTVSAARERYLAGRQAWLLGDRAGAIAAFDRIGAGATRYGSVSRVLSRVIAGRLDAARAAAAPIAAGTLERAAAELAIAEAAHDTAGVLAAFARVEQLSTTIEQLFGVADALERSARFDEAAAMFQRLAGHPHAWSEPIASTRAWYRLGRLRERAGDRAAARAAYDEVIRRWGSATARIPEADDARRRVRALAAAR